VARDAAGDARDIAGAITAYYLAPKSPEMTCPMIALAPEAAHRAPNDPLHRAYNDGVRGLFDIFAELATADGSPATADRLRMLFAAMVGSNMLLRSGHGEGASTSFKQSILAATDISGGEAPTTQ
jgi:TetR/AcrR family transcriptional repressor of nem operon